MRHRGVAIWLQTSPRNRIRSTFSLNAFYTGRLHSSLCARRRGVINRFGSCAANIRGTDFCQVLDSSPSAHGCADSAGAMEGSQLGQRYRRHLGMSGIGHYNGYAWRPPVYGSRDYKLQNLLRRPERYPLRSSSPVLSLPWLPDPSTNPG